MKQHLTAIAANEKELESYVSQLKSERFEIISDVKKSEDGTFYQALAKATRHEGLASQITAELLVESASPQA